MDPPTSESDKPLPTLPPEILAMIFEQHFLNDLGERDLAELALVSPDSLEAARDSLYSRLSLRHHASVQFVYGPYSELSGDALERTLINSPSLAARCKEMHVFLHARRRSSTLADAERLWRVIDVCERLESLEFTTHGNFDLQVPLGIGRSLAGLRSLSLESIDGGASNSALLAGCCRELVHLRHLTVNLTNLRNSASFPPPSFALALFTLKINSSSSFLARRLTYSSQETLEELDISGGVYGDIGLFNFGRLAKLSIKTDIDDLSVEEFLDGFELPVCAALRNLSITTSKRSHSPGGDLIRLPITSLPPSLDSLHLDIPQLDPVSLTAYLDSPSASELHSLGLCEDGIPFRAVNELERLCKGRGIVFSAWSDWRPQSKPARAKVDYSIFPLERE